MSEILAQLKKMGGSGSDSWFDEPYSYFYGIVSGTAFTGKLQSGVTIYPQGTNGGMFAACIKGLKGTFTTAGNIGDGFVLMDKNGAIVRRGNGVTINGDYDYIFLIWYRDNREIVFTES